jgi:hypothetical protein
MRGLKFLILLKFTALHSKLDIYGRFGVSSAAGNREAQRYEMEIKLKLRWTRYIARTWYIKKV